MTHRRESAVKYKDLETIRDALRSYRDYRKAHSLEPSAFWPAKVMTDLQEQGFNVRLRAAADKAIQEET
jgi:hypothetical protein